MQYFSFDQKLALLRSLTLKQSPAYVQFYITARCNLSCEQCNIIYAHGDSQEMNIAQIRKTAENLKEIGVCIVLLIGGEPFFRKDLPEIVKAFTDVGIHVRLQTNGLATEKAIEQCVENGAHDISISLDSLEPEMQDSINGDYPKSWERAIKTISIVNKIFPQNGTAFFGTVLMPKNIFDIPDVIEFAKEIGWGDSLVPAHISTQDRPQGFRTFDPERVCRFTQQQLPAVKKLLRIIRDMRDQGYPLYDSDEYLDDIYRFLANEPLRWREKNGNVCDSPNLYFAIEPNGNISPCCDFKLNKFYPVYSDDFPKLYFNKTIHQSVYTYTKNCGGCMYGSYPEITISSRYWKPMLERALYFNIKSQKTSLRKISPQEMFELATHIYQKNKNKREELKREYLGF